MAVMGQPPLFQPCRLSRACVELMWVKRCWSLLKEGSGGPEGETEVREAGKGFPGVAGVAVVPGDWWEAWMGVGMLQGTEGEEEKERERDEESKAWPGGRRRQEKGRGEPSVCHPLRGSGASFSYCDSSRCCSDGTRWGLPRVSMLPCALLPHPRTCHPVPGLTPPMGLGLDDLTDAPRAHAVLGRQLHLVPRAAREAIQPEGPLARADEHILPLLTVVHRVLQHEAWPGGLAWLRRGRAGPGVPNSCNGTGLCRGPAGGTFGHWDGVGAN